MHRARSWVALLAVAVLVASCGNTTPTPAPSTPAATTAAPTATPAPTPSPTPTAAPTPSAPPDASKAFNASLTNPMFAAHVDVIGVSTVAGVTIPMKGTLDIQPGVTHSVMTVTVSGKASTTETITAGGKEYGRTAGVWFDNGAPSGNNLGRLISEVGGFRDTGIQTKNGKELHHMELPAGTAIPADALGLAGATNVVIALEAWSEEDGTPALMTFSVTWDQPSGTTTLAATMTMELAFSGSPAEVTVPTEDELWAWKVSTIHKYQIAYPSAWEYVKGNTKTADFFNGFDGSYLAVFHVARKGVTLNEFASYATKNTGDWAGLKSAKVDATKATRLAGVAARRIDYHGKYSGKTWYVLSVLAVKGSYLYEVTLWLPHKATAADRAMMDTYLATFSFK